MESPEFEYPDWRNYSHCANTHMNGDDFEMRKGESHRTARVRMIAQICTNLCPVTEECLIAAVQEGDKHSIRGGLTPGQRANIEVIN